MVNAQEWLDREYPKENRTEITELDIRGKNLEGVLDLSDFSSLETLWCSSNQLTNLNLSNCGKLNELDCKDNPNLTNLDLNNCRKLKSLTLYKGYLNTELDLSKFPRLKEDKINWVINAQTWLEKNYPQGFTKNYLYYLIIILRTPKLINLRKKQL